MKDLATRSLFGFIYVALIFAACFNAYTLGFLLGVFGILTVIEFSKLNNTSIFLCICYFIITFFFLGIYPLLQNNIPVFNTIKYSLISLTIITNSFLIFDLFSKKAYASSVLKTNWYIIFYITTPLLCLFWITSPTKIFNPNILLGVFTLIWINDSFAYLVGKTLGKHKLFKSISPKKTIEGFLGGLLFCCLSSYAIMYFTHTLNFSTWFIVSIIVSIIGTLGDLIESKFKRRANTKDSGNIIPGHGGMFDRLDSIIFAAPFIYTLLIILKHVS